MSTTGEDGSPLGADEPRVMGGLVGAVEKEVGATHEFSADSCSNWVSIGRDFVRGDLPICPLAQTARAGVAWSIETATNAAKDANWANIIVVEVALCRGCIQLSVELLSLEGVPHPFYTAIYRPLSLLFGVGLTKYGPPGMSPCC